MFKQKIKDALLDAAGRPQIGWVAENADHLAEKIAEALGLADAPKPALPVLTPATDPIEKPSN